MASEVIHTHALIQRGKLCAGTGSIGAQDVECMCIFPLGFSHRSLMPCSQITCDAAAHGEGFSYAACRRFYAFPPHAAAREREREPRRSRTEDMHVGSLSVRLTCARRGLHELRGLSTARGALEQCLRAHHRRLLVERRVRRLDRCVLVRLVEGERHVA